MQIKSRESRKALEQKLAATLEKLKNSLGSPSKLSQATVRMPTELSELLTQRPEPSRKASWGRRRNLATKYGLTKQTTGLLLVIKVYLGNPSDEEMLRIAV